MDATNLIEPDALTIERLMLIKRAYADGAARASQGHNEITRIAAIVLIDFANETALKAAANAMSAGPVERTFPGLVRQVVDLLEKANVSVPSARRLTYVHDKRNAAQHAARYPTDTELAEAVLYSRDFLRELLIGVWSVDLDTLSVARLIRDEGLREWMVRAESSSRPVDLVDPSSSLLRRSTTPGNWSL